MAKQTKNQKPAPVAGDLVITVRAKENPKRRQAAIRFALYRTGMTVAQYVKAVTSRRLHGGAAIAYRDLQWDSKVGHIALSEAKQKAA